jgi:hypothetical protein
MNLIYTRVYNRYKNDKEIEAMTNLVSAYQKKEINEFEHILKGKKREKTDIEDMFSLML